jgi:CRISPR-associated protein Cmr2
MTALTGYFEGNNISNAAERKNIADKLYESKTDEVRVNGRGKITNTDKYYAILMMDGDNMGKLVSGETIAATWKSIMHPEIAARLVSDGFIDPYRKVWEKIYGDAGLNRRLVTPAIHAAISESLGDFSMYGVAPIIEKYNGRLIYAGGDDVCAFLPVGKALFAAREIQEYYTSTFRLINMKGDSTAISGEWTPQPGKMSINLGKGDDISISAAILICHHKESLTQMIKEAHDILDKEAKEKAGRNACVVELRKRHGGSRYFTRKWTDKESWDAFEKIGNLSMQEGRQLSRSLLYRLETMRNGMEAIINYKENNDKNLAVFIAKQLERSGLKSKDDKKEIAGSIARIVWDKQDSKRLFNPEGLLVAAFMGGEEEND